MDPTDPVPDYVLTVGIEGEYAIVTVRATGPNDITVAMDDLHRHAVDELRKHTWPRGYSIVEVRWDVENTINGRVEQMTAMARLHERNDPDWESVQAAVEADQKMLAELRFQRDLEEGGLT